MCHILDKKNGFPALQGVRKGNLFVADLVFGCKDEVNYFYAKASPEESWLWHNRLSHLKYKNYELSSQERIGQRSASDGVHTGRAV